MIFLQNVFLHELRLSVLNTAGTENSRLPENTAASAFQSSSSPILNSDRYATINTYSITVANFTINFFIRILISQAFLLLLYVFNLFML